MMTTFEFWLYPGRESSETDRQPRRPNLALQDSSTSAAQGNRLTQDVVKTLLKDRTDTGLSIFWARILQSKTTDGDSDH